MIWGCSGIFGDVPGWFWDLLRLMECFRDILGVIRGRVGVFWGWVICGDGEEAVDGGLGGWQG